MLLRSLRSFCCHGLLLTLVAGQSHSISQGCHPELDINVMDDGLVPHHLLQVSLQSHEDSTHAEVGDRGSLVNTSQITSGAQTRLADRERNATSSQHDHGIILSSHNSSQILLGETSASRNNVSNTTSSYILDKELDAFFQPIEEAVAAAKQQPDTLQASSEQITSQKNNLVQSEQPALRRSKVVSLTWRSWCALASIQLAFGILYYITIMRKYPRMPKDFEPTDESTKLQSMDALDGARRTTCSNRFLSVVCCASRAAHTFHQTGVFDFWPSCILMSLFPCCTLFVVSSFTDLDNRLGGERRGIFSSFYGACCCFFCLLAKHAQSLDIIANARTGILDVQPTTTLNARWSSSNNMIVTINTLNDP